MPPSAIAIVRPDRCQGPRCRSPLPAPAATGRVRFTCCEACKKRRQRKLAKDARRASVEWYTPPEVLDWFSDRWGPFDFDPCSTPSAPVWNLIPDHLTAADDGLVTPWRGRCAFVNPPYGRGLLARWTDRGFSAVRDAEVGLAAFLVPLRPSSAWTRLAVDRGAVLEPLPFRVRFYEPRPDGSVVQGSSALFETTAIVFRDAAVSRFREAA